MIQGILDLRFTESIREDEGGTYGVSSNASLSQFPEEKAEILNCRLLLATLYHLA